VFFSHQLHAAMPEMAHPLMMKALAAQHLSLFSKPTAQQKSPKDLPDF